MAPGLLRDWNTCPIDTNVEEKSDEAPIMATLVADNFPKIYRKGNILFQQVYKYGMLGMQPNSSELNGDPGISKDHSYDLENQPSYSSWIYDDEPECGQVDIVDGRLISGNSMDDDEDDLYEDAVQNRRKSNRIKLLKKFKRKAKDSKNKSKKKVQDNKGKKQIQLGFANNFPLPLGCNDAVKKNKKLNQKKFGKSSKNKKDTFGYQIPLATPCANPANNYYHDEIHPVKSSAPAKQKMSRAAYNFMKEAKIIRDEDISDLGTDTDVDPTAIYHAHTDTDMDMVSPMPQDFTSQSTLSSEEISPISWGNFMKESNIVLHNDISESNTDHSDVVTSNRRDNNVRTQSLPNVFMSKISSPRKKDQKINDMKNYTSRLEHIKRLSSQLQYPTTPRKHRRRESEEISLRVSTPPQQLFKCLSPLQQESQCQSPCVPRIKRIVPKDKYNDTLKVVFVGSPETGKSSLVNALAQKKKKHRKDRKSFDLNIETWNPTPMNGDQDIKFTLWDLQGGSLDTGAHHATQSLFFSSSSLYVLVWDMSVNESSLRERLSSDDSDECNVGDCDYDSDYDEEMRNEQMDHLLERHIEDNVLYWIDHLSQKAPRGCAIMPVVTFKDKLGEEEAERRRDLLMNHLKIEIDRRTRSHLPQLVFDSQGNIPLLSSTEKEGIAEFQQCLLDVANNRCTNSEGIAETFFRGHFQSKLCAVIRSVQKILSALKETYHNVVRLDHIWVELTENPPAVDELTQSLVINALQFLSSIGSIMYFGPSDKSRSRFNHLGAFVVLSPKWLSDALSCSLRSKSLDQLRKGERDVVIGKPNQSLPIFSQNETIQLLNHKFIQKENNKICGTGSNDLYYFLQQVCEQYGIFVPISIAAKGGNHAYYLLPMFADQVPAEPWNHRVKENWKTTLCNSFTFDNRIPHGLVDKVAVTMLKSLFELTFQDTTHPIKIERIFYYKTAIYARVSEEIPEGELIKSHKTEIFAHLLQEESPLCVSSATAFGGRRLLVSAKGAEGGSGDKIWNLGYTSVLDSIELVTNKYVKGPIKRQMACPTCLRTMKANNAAVWDSDEITYDHETIPCSNGHQTNPQILLGPFEDIDDNASLATGVHSVFSAYTTYTNASICSYLKADDMLPGIVLVALWDRTNNSIIRVGSGFIADSRRGLIITASHVLYNFGSDKRYGNFDEPFFGISEATAIIGMNQKGNGSAIFTYCADIIASDVKNVDGCVLQIKNKFMRPIELDKNYLSARAELPISSREGLKRLKMTTDHEREQEVRVIGYRQTGEGLLGAGVVINRVACVNKGFVCKTMDSDSNQSENKYVPKSEIVVACSTGVGNSGGPFVNEVGEVIGILSRSDPVETQRCYLTSAKELKILLRKAKKRYDRADIILQSYPVMEEALL